VSWINAKIQSKDVDLHDPCLGNDFPDKGPVSQHPWTVLNDVDQRNQKVNMSQHIQACE